MRMRKAAALNDCLYDKYELFLLWDRNYILYVGYTNFNLQHQRGSYGRFGQEPTFFPDKFRSN
jgi:hypothetical protein